MQVEFEQSVVAGLGTVCVKGFHQSFEAAVPSAEAAPEKPVLVSETKMLELWPLVVVVVGDDGCSVGMCLLCCGWCSSSWENTSMSFGVPG